MKRKRNKEKRKPQESTRGNARKGRQQKKEGKRERTK